MRKDKTYASGAKTSLKEKMKNVNKIEFMLGSKLSIKLVVNVFLMSLKLMEKQFILT